MNSIFFELYPQSFRGSKKFKVFEVEEFDDVFVIYAQRKDSIFKIITKSVPELDCKKKSKLKINKYYKLNLTSLTSSVFINGVKVDTWNTNEFLTCINIWGQIFCIEPERGINELYKAENLNGLYFVKN
ncbi:hypothetical protein OAO55_01165 [Bacteroidales bacterium]|nr:hypothetical protein [Bacteroidales bacterium]